MAKAVRAQKIEFVVIGEIVDDGVCVKMGELGRGSVCEADFGTTFRAVADVAEQQGETQVNGTSDNTLEEVRDGAAGL